MKLVKLPNNEFVILGDGDIFVDWKYLTSDKRIVTWFQDFEDEIKENRPKPILFSTQKIEKTNSFDKIPNWLEIKSSIVDLTDQEKFDITVKHTRYEMLSPSSDIGQGVISGYNQCLKDNQDKCYTIDDIQWIVNMCIGKRDSGNSESEILDELEKYLKPKEEWGVELNSNNVLKLVK